MIQITSILCTLFVASSCNEICGLNYKLTGGGDRILGGREARDNEFPWMVSIQFYDPVANDWYHNCGGAILSDRLILTAAHCGTHVIGHTARVVAGCSKIHGQPGYSMCQTISLSDEDFIAHQWFVKTSDYRSQTDIGLIKLKQRFRFTNQESGALGPICVPFHDVPDLKIGDIVEAAGWGLMEDPYAPDYFRQHLVQMSDSLKTVKLEVLDPVMCHYYYRAFSDKYQICVGSSTLFKDTCGGDSGGPIMIVHKGRYYVMGVVSQGKLCGRGADHPSLYTRVQSFTDWIAAASQTQDTHY